MGEEKRNTGKIIGRRLLVVLLILVLILGPVVSIKTQIRFSAQNYTEESEAYAAQVTEEEAAYLSDDPLSRQWKYLQTIGHPPRTYKDYNLYADIAIANEDLESAANYLNSGIDTARNEADAALMCLRLGSIYILQGNREGAEKMLDEAVSQDASLASAWFLRAQLAASEGDTEQAVQSFHSYIRLPDRDAKETLALGELFESREDYESAALCYTAGIEDESLTKAALYADRARCEILLDDRAAARKDLETYFEQTEEDPEGRPAAMLAMCLMEDEAYKEAAEYFHKAIEDGYEEPAVLYSQSAKSAFAAGDYEMSAEDGLKALSLLKEAGSGTEGTGNDTEGAGKDTDSGVDRTETEFWIGLAYLAQDVYKESAAHLTEVKAADVDYPDIDYYLGVCALAQEEYTTAEEYFTASIEKEEDLAASYYNRAICYINKEDYSRAKADLQQALTLADEEELKTQVEELAEALKELS